MKKIISVLVPFIFIFSGVVQATPISTGNVKFVDDGRVVVHSNNGVDESVVADFAGINSNELNDISSGTNYGGSAFQDSIAIQAGHTFSFYWRWVTDESINTYWNDFAFINLSLGDTELLADTSTPDNTIGKFSWTAMESGLLTYTVGLLNVNDNIMNSRLTVNHISIAEPALLGVLGLALFGFAYSRRTKK